MLPRTLRRTAAGKSPIDEVKALRDLKDLQEYRESFTDGPAGAPGPPGSPGGRGHDGAGSGRTVPGAVVFQNSDEMLKMSAPSAVGTLAYVVDEQALLVRVNSGWQYVLLGTLVSRAAPPAAAPAQPLPAPAANLIETAPSPRRGPSLRLAALNEPGTGDTHGIRGADYACYRQSRRAGLRGTFRAFLTSRVQNIDSIVRWADRSMPVVNTRGDVLFTSWASMFDGSGGLFSHAPRIYSFNGKNIVTDSSWPHKVVWHGSHAAGERAMETYCDAWHSSNPDKQGLASSLHSNKLLDQETYSCNNRFAILCIEATSAAGRRRRRDLSSVNTTDYSNEEDYLYNSEQYQQLLNEIFAQNNTNNSFE